MKVLKVPLCVTTGLFTLIHGTLAIPSRLSRSFDETCEKEELLTGNTDLTTLPDLPTTSTIDPSSIPPHDTNSTIAHRQSFVIENCGDHQNYMKYILLNVMDILAPALEDVRNGDKSQYGFLAMFKSNDAVPTILNLLRHMYLFIGLPGLRPTPSQFSQPRFACVDSNAARMFANLRLGYDPMSRCSDATVSTTLERSFYADNTVYIFICPSFFSLRPKPDSGVCPNVMRNQFVGSQNDFHQGYQVYTMIYGLIRFYLGQNALDEESNPREVFDWNACVFNLNLLESVINPTNLEIYVACEFFPSWIG